MFQSTKQENDLTPMFDLCRQISPYLDGDFQDISTDNNEKKIWLEGNEQDLFTIQTLHDDLQKNSPDAGNAYWMTSTLGLLCWQPVYIAFIAIYGLKQLPDFRKFKQQHQHNSVTGFVFQSNILTTGEAEQLIELAGDQLTPLFEHYRLQLDSFSRCRPGYVKRLIADLVLACLINIRDSLKVFSNQDLQRHAQLWLAALGLPAHLINALQIQDNQPISHIRTSCCLAYKANHELCTNCPKKHKK